MLEDNLSVVFFLLKLCEKQNYTTVLTERLTIETY